MKKNQEKTTPKSQQTPLSLRPSESERAQLEGIVKELRKSAPAICADFVTDCLEMLATGNIGVPKTVEMIRVLRSNNATYSSVQPQNNQAEP